MGSGTTLIVANSLGCHAYGLDTNPIAVKIAQAKSLRINDYRLKEIDDFLHWLSKKKNTENYKNDNFPCVDLFENSELWFRNDVAYYIHEILSELARYSSEVRNFLEIGLSTLLKGMSNARMDSVIPILPDNHNYIDRKHYYRQVDNLTRNIPVFNRLYSQINRMKKAILCLNKEIDKNLICKPIFGDARKISNFVEKCNLVVTSPPYWSAQNYEKIHMLSMKLFGLNTVPGSEIGRDRESYLHDMKAVFNQISLILDGYFALVIGHDDKMHTHEKLLNLACDIGFHHVDTFTRRISNQVSRAKQIKNEYIYILTT